MKKNIYSIVLLLALALTAGSCKKMLDVEPKDKLDSSRAYQTLADADAAVLGVYGKFLGLAKQYILLNELRADLVDITNNADPYLKQISAHTVQKDNPYTNPRPFYEVIGYCNDVLKNLNIMKSKSLISVDEYGKRYSDIGALRSWIYLQLGIHYGNIPYITEPIENIDDLKNLAEYERVPFDNLIDTLISFTAALPYKESYAYPTGNTLVITIDANSTRKFFINKPILIGDLYLWKNNYTQSAAYYKMAMDAEPASSNDYFDTFKISNTTIFGIGYSNGNDLTGVSLVNSVTTGWRSMFTLPNTDRNWNTEWYWSLPYTSQFDPGNPFIDLFSYTNGSYLLKPSQFAIDNWNSQVQRGGQLFDARGVLSTRTEAGNPVISKFTENSTFILNKQNRGGQWNIWRAAGLHLRYAEAANRAGYPKLGWALLNIGIANTFSPNAVSAPTAANVDLMQAPYSEPFYFDARNSGSGNSVFRRPWYRNNGVRARVNMPALSLDLQSNVLGLEDKLIEEASLELAFEGNRWSDLMRIAKRRNDPYFLADRIAAKLRKSNNGDAEAVRILLSDPKNWYLPFE